MHSDTSLLWSGARIQVQIGGVDVVREHGTFSITFRKSGFYHICVSVLYFMQTRDRYETFGAELLRNSISHGTVDVLLKNMRRMSNLTYYTIVLQEIVYLETNDSLTLKLSGIHAVNFNYHANYFMAYKLS